MKIILFLSFVLLPFFVFSQKENLIEEIDNYISSLKPDKTDNFQEQLDDETHFIKVYRQGKKILWIEGKGNGEFNSFNYSFYYRNNKLVYSSYFLSTLKGHWSELEDKETEYHEREEDVYYKDDTPIQVRGYDSDTAVQNDSEDEENTYSETEDKNIDMANQIGCVKMAYEFLKRYKADF